MWKQPRERIFSLLYTESVSEDEKTGKQVRKRSFASIPLNRVIERQKKGLPSAPEDANGNLPIFVLSPNDLVYLPTEEERKNNTISLPLDRERIYKVVSFTGNRLFLIPFYIASVVRDKYEYTSINKIELTDDKRSIKEFCLLLKVDRLGNVTLE